MILQSLAGLPAFLAYFCTAFVITVGYLFVYTWITPHDEFELIRKNVPGAAIALGLRQDRGQDLAGNVRVQEPVAVLRKHGWNPHRIVNAKTYEPAE